MVRGQHRSIIKRHHLDIAHPISLVTSWRIEHQQIAQTKVANEGAPAVAVTGQTNIPLLSRGGCAGHVIQAKGHGLALTPFQYVAADFQAWRI